MDLYINLAGEIISLDKLNPDHNPLSRMAKNSRYEFRRDIEAGAKKLGYAIVRIAEDDGEAGFIARLTRPDGSAISIDGLDQAGAFARGQRR